MPVTVRSSKSKFFPRPYQPDIDGPPIFMLDEAKEKLFSFSRHLSYTTLHEQLCLLTDCPGYAAFFLTSLDRYERLLDAKPVLIQECVADDPWKVLVAVMLLNKTAGRVAVPIFWRLIERWPSPESLAKADYAELEDCIRSLGLQSTRAKRLIALSSAYVEERDRPEDLLTPISHLPGSGPYALDCASSFCSEGDHISERRINKCNGTDGSPRYHRSGAGLLMAYSGRPRLA